MPKFITLELSRPPAAPSAPERYITIVVDQIKCISDMFDPARGSYIWTVGNNSDEPEIEVVETRESIVRYLITGEWE